MEHSIWGLFDAVADRIGDREAIVWRDQRRTYAEVRDRALRFASVLADHGLRRHTPRSALEPWQSGQDMVGCYLLNSPEYLEVTLGGYAASTAPFNVNYRYVADELVYLLDDAGARAIVFHERYADTLADVLPRLRTTPQLLVQVSEDGSRPLLDGAIDYETALNDASPLAEPDPSPDDLCVVYTGGTTGMPKGTLWRQDDLFMTLLGGDLLGEGVDQATVVNVAAGSSLRMLPNAPFMHGGAFGFALRTLVGGGTVFVNDTVDHFDPADMLRIIERERITMTFLIGEAMVRPVIKELQANAHDVSSLMIIVVGAAPTSPETKTQLLELIPNAMVIDGASATETGSGLAAISTKGATTEAAVFTPNADVAVLSEDRTRKLAAGDEEIGWFAKTGRLALGYLGDPAKTAATFPTVVGERWSVPGDRARLLADGKVQLLGRDAQTINTGGEKVFAEEVEAAVLTHPDVVDVVVVGRTSERWGSEVVAVVACVGEPSDDELLKAAGERIARYKLPKAFVRVPSIVRSPSGKADYRWARDAATEQ